MIERSDNRGAVQYHYDSRDRLIEVSSVNGLIARYAYDPVGRRIYKDVRHGDTILRTRFYWAGEQMIREETQAVSAGGDPVLGSLGSSRDYLYWPESYTPMLLRVSGNGANGAVYNYHNDPGGGVARVTDRSGAVVWQAGHGAFGGAAPVVQQIVQPLRFAGQYHDSETGLHYNRYRYYDPALGRYITRDPLGITQGLNVYCYSGNDPIGRCDPMGLWGWKETLSIVAAVVVGAVVLATLPVSVPLLVIAAGASVGAVGFGLNEALNQEEFCLKCILKAGGKGFVIGGLTAAAFLTLPASAGVTAFAGYALDHAMTPGHKWDWGEAATATGIGAFTAGMRRRIFGPKPAAPPRQQPAPKTVTPKSAPKPATKPAPKLTPKPVPKPTPKTVPPKPAPKPVKPKPDDEAFERLNKIDADTGTLRPSEANAAVAPEKQIGQQLARSVEKNKGDFVFTSGPKAGESLDFLFAVRDSGAKSIQSSIIWVTKSTANSKHLPRQSTIRKARIGNWLPKIRTVTN
jgi:RHS repeat-associated protein